MTSPYVYEVRPFKGKRLTIGTSILIGCILCLTSVHAVAEQHHNTDADFTKELIGTWELVPSLSLFLAKTLLVFSANGTVRTIEIGNYRGAPRCVETHTIWRVTSGSLAVQKAD